MMSSVWTETYLHWQLSRQVTLCPHFKKKSWYIALMLADKTYDSIRILYALQYCPHVTFRSIWLSWTPCVLLLCVSCLGLKQTYAHTTMSPYVCFCACACSRGWKKTDGWQRSPTIITCLYQSTLMWYICQQHDVINRTTRPKSSVSRRHAITVGSVISNVLTVVFSGVLEVSINKRHYVGGGVKCFCVVRGTKHT